MIQSFGTLLDIPIYSSSLAELVPADPRQDWTGVDLIGWLKRIWGYPSAERQALLVWN